MDINETTEASKAGGVVLHGSVTPGGTARIKVQANSDNDDDDSEIEYNDSFVLSDSD